MNDRVRPSPTGSGIPAAVRLLGRVFGSPLTTFVVVTRAREAGRRDADRPARAAWVVQRLLAARW
jgi:hypothetical protein